MNISIEELKVVVKVKSIFCLKSKVWYVQCYIQVYYELYPFPRKSQIDLKKKGTLFLRTGRMLKRYVASGSQNFVKLRRKPEQHRICLIKLIRLLDSKKIVNFEMEIVPKLNSEIQLKSDFLKKEAMIIKTDILSSKVRKNATTSNLMLYVLLCIITICIST